MQNFRERRHGRSAFIHQSNCPKSSDLRRKVPRGTLDIRPKQFAILVSFIFVLLTTLSAEAGQTYYVDSTSSAPSRGTAAEPFHTIQEAAHILDKGDTAIVRGGSEANPRLYPERVKFSGNPNSGTAAERITVRAEPRRSVTMYGFRTKGTDYLTIDGFRITIPVSILDGDWTAEYALYIRSDHVSLNDNYIFDVPGVGIEGSTSEPWPVGAIITNNHLYRCGQGIVAFGDDWLIEHNEVERLVQHEYFELDADYMRGFGNDITIRYNWLHGSRIEEIGTSHTDGFQTFTENDYYLHGLVFESNFVSDFDQGVIMSSDEVSGEVSDIVIRNNVFERGALDGAYGVLAKSGCENVLVFHNLVGTMQHHGVSFSDGASGVVTNNIFYNAGSNYFGKPGSSIVGGYNLINRQESPYYKESTDIVDVDPLFIDADNFLGADGVPFTQDDGFRLRPESPAINAGTNLGVAEDFFGMPRPQPAGGAPDIGPHEYTVFGPVEPAPSLSIGSPTASSTSTGPVSYTVTYSDADSVDLRLSDVTLNATGDATASVSVINGTTFRPTVIISFISGDGTLGISIDSGTASNAEGKSAPATGPSGTFIVDSGACSSCSSGPALSLVPRGEFFYRGRDATVYVHLAGGSEPYSGFNARVILPPGVTVSSIGKGALLPAGFETDFQENTLPEYSLIGYSEALVSDGLEGNLLELSVSVGASAPEGLQTLSLIPGRSGISDTTGAISVEHDIPATTVFVLEFSDADGDGMDDTWEVFYFGNTNRDGFGDYDRDGLSDLQEFLTSVQPDVQDSDKDGISDGDEVEDGEDPGDPTPSGTDVVWVDFAPGEAGRGTISSPYRTLRDASTAVVRGGKVIMRGDSSVTTSDERPVIARAMTLESYSGAVAVGLPSASRFLGVEQNYSSESEASEEANGSPRTAYGSLAVSSSGESESGSTIRVAMDELIRERAIPLYRNDIGLRLARRDAPISIRLHGDRAINPQSIWATLTNTLDGSESNANATWHPVSGDKTEDLWVVFFTETDWGAGSQLRTVVGGYDEEGAMLGPHSYDVVVSGDSDAENLDDVVALVPEPGIPGLPGGIGVPHRVMPEEVFIVPVELWLEVPRDLPVEDYRAYYLYQDEDGTMAWYPAHNVIGWYEAGSESVIVENGRKYVTMRVSHTGVVQIGPKDIPAEFRKE